MGSMIVHNVLIYSLFPFMEGGLKVVAQTCPGELGSTAQSPLLPLPAHIKR